MLTVVFIVALFLAKPDPFYADAHTLLSSPVLPATPKALFKGLKPLIIKSVTAVLNMLYTEEPVLVIWKLR